MLPSSGEVWLGDTDLAVASERPVTRIRRERIGFVFQSYNLMPMLSVRDNVALPLRLAGKRPGRKHVREALELVGMSEFTKRRPAELSGGQQQRVAIASGSAEPGSDSAAGVNGAPVVILALGWKSVRHHLALFVSARSNMG